MNKKVIAVVTGVVLILVIGIGLSTLKKKGIEPGEGLKAITKKSLKVESPAKYLPKDIVMIYSMRDVQGSWKTIKNSRYYEQVQSLKALTDFGLKESFGQIISEFEKQLGGLKITESRIMDLLGQQVIFGVQPSAQENNVKIYIQSYVGKTTQFVEASLKSIKENNDYSNQRETYLGEDIVTFIPKSQDNPEIRYSMVSNILTLTFGKTEKEMKQVIDLIKGQSSESLAKDALFSKAYQSLPDQGELKSFYYTDVSKLKNLIDTFIKPLIENQSEQFGQIDFDEVIKNLAQIKFVMGQVSQTDDGLKMSTYIVPNMSQMDEKAKNEWNKPLNPLKSLPFIPNDVILYNASSNIDLKAIWTTIQEAESGQGGMNPLEDFFNGLKEFESSFNLNVEKDLIDLIDNEIGFIFQGVNLGGLFPIPQVALLIKSNDSKALISNLISMIEKMIGQSNSPLPLTIQDQTVENQVFKLISTPLGAGLSPVIGAGDDFVLISINSSMAAKILQTKNGSIKNLSTSDGFKDIMKEQGGQIKSQLSYVDLEKLNTLIGDILNWVLQRKDLIPQSDQYGDIITNISTYAIPFIDTLKVFQKAVFTTEKEKDQTVQTVRLNMKDLK